MKIIFLTLTQVEFFFSFLYAQYCFPLFLFNRTRREREKKNVYNLASRDISIAVHCTKRKCNENEYMRRKEIENNDDDDDHDDREDNWVENSTTSIGFFF